MTRLVQIGLGPLGQKMVRFALARGLRIVAAVDPAADKTGRDLGELCGLPRLNVRVRASLAEALRGRSADAAMITTVSALKAFLPQAAAAVRAGLDIVSTCEELSFPWEKQPALAARLDRLCRQHGVTCLGTGVNPGYLMDFLPTVLTGLCQDVRAVRVWRVQDASVRRVPFQQKIGAGLTPAQFRAKVRAGTLRHVGLPESVGLIARRLGWILTRQTESLAPILATRAITSGYMPIRKGMACGVQQFGRGFMGSREVISLTFRAAVGEPQSYDRIEIDGEPPVRSTIEGGVNGDIATCAIALNAIRSVGEAAPGLKTMCEITPVAFWEA